MGVAGICHTGFNRNNTDQWFPFDAGDNVFRLHAFKFINRLYQYIGKYQFLCDQLLGVFVILRLIDEIWRENDFDWQWEIDKGSEAFADSGMQ